MLIGRKNKVKQEFSKSSFRKISVQSPGKKNIMLRITIPSFKDSQHRDHLHYHDHDHNEHPSLPLSLPRSIITTIIIIIRLSFFHLQIQSCIILACCSCHLSAGPKCSPNTLEEVDVECSKPHIAHIHELALRGQGIFKLTGQNLFLIVSLLPSAILKTHLFVNVQNFFVLLFKMNNCSVPYLFNSELTKSTKRGQEVSFLVLESFRAILGCGKTPQTFFQPRVTFKR